MSENFIHRKEVPPYDVTTKHGDDKDGNTKLVITVEKDNSFTAEEIAKLEEGVLNLLKSFNKSY